jgi:hypothetical protein
VDASANAAVSNSEAHYKSLLQSGLAGFGFPLQLWYSNTGSSIRIPSFLSLSARWFSFRLLTDESI